MALHIVRHGSAGSRPYANGDDLERPLDMRGREQATRVANHFASADVREIWSSLATRCIETVEPLASDHEINIATFRELTEGAAPIDVIEMLRTHAHLEGDLVMCSHGDLIPEVINALYRDGMSVVGARGCEKGSVWTLHTRGRDILRATYTAKP